MPTQRKTATSSSRRLSYGQIRECLTVYTVPSWQSPRNVDVLLEEAMKNTAILLSLLGFAGPISGQTAIHRCVTDDAVVYQDTPCKTGQTAALIDAQGRVLAATSAGASDPKQESQSRTPSQLAGLVVGMTDTEVLNLRGWGRPSKITRMRANRAWREEWAYFSPADGQRVLRFVNGTLTAINTDPVALVAPERIAQNTPQ
jgi:hypothetical protein